MEEASIEKTRAKLLNLGKNIHKQRSLMIFPDRESINASLLLLIPIRHDESNPCIQQRDSGNINNRRTEKYSFKSFL